MTPEQIATQVRDTIRDISADTPRAQQSADRKLGMSDIGQCRSMLARMIDGHERHQRPDDIKLAAFIGTAVGNLLESRYPNSQVPVTCVLPNGVKVRGTADVVNDDSVWDFKTTASIDMVRRNGPDFAHPVTATCDVYWGSHGCTLPSGHDGQHLCTSCCTLDTEHLLDHAFASKDDYGAHGCAGTWPYYGHDNMAGANAPLPFVRDNGSDHTELPDEFDRLAALHQGSRKEHP